MMVNMRSLAAALSAAACFGAAGASPARQPPTTGVSSRQTASTFWYSNIDHTSAVRGYAPDLDSDYSYQVYRAVAPGSGAAAIQAAIYSGSNGNARHGKWFASQPRVCISLCLNMDTS